MYIIVKNEKVQTSKTDRNKTIWSWNIVEQMVAEQLGK